MYLHWHRTTPSIEYSIDRTAFGWNLNVTIHGEIPASDRVLLLNWIRAYATQVKTQVPSAVTLFRITPTGYALDVAVNDLLPFGLQYATQSLEPIQKYA